MAVAQDLLEKSGDRQSSLSGTEKAAEHLPPSDKKIYDLIDVISVEASSEAANVTDNARVLPGKKIHELVDEVKADYPTVSSDRELEAAVMKKVYEITERITRELVPDIAERIIREEIEKLKG
jgi:hypothetical protein